MKKKNTFKPTDFKYEPIDMKQPHRWMHSIQTCRTEKTSIGEVIVIVFIMIVIAVIWSILA